MSRKYNASRILDCKIVSENKMEFLIRWKSKSHCPNTWETQENLDICPDLLVNFCCQKLCKAPDVLLGSQLLFQFYIGD